VPFLGLPCALQEPAKVELLAYESGNGPLPPRQALVVLQVPAIPSVYELVVDLGEDKVIKAKKVRGSCQ
jgi:Cu2+-containing amine oxidase